MIKVLRISVSARKCSAFNTYLSPTAPRAQKTSWRGRKRGDTLSLEHGMAIAPLNALKLENESTFQQASPTGLSVQRTGGGIKDRK